MCVDSGAHQEPNSDDVCDVGGQGPASLVMVSAMAPSFPCEEAP